MVTRIDLLSRTPHQTQPNHIKNQPTAVVTPDSSAPNASTATENSKNSKNARQPLPHQKQALPPTAPAPPFLLLCPPQQQHQQQAEADALSFSTPRHGYRTRTATTTTTSSVRSRRSEVGEVFAEAGAQNRRVVVDWSKVEASRVRHSDDSSSSSSSVPNTSSKKQQQERSFNVVSPVVVQEDDDVFTAASILGQISRHTATPGDNLDDPNLFQNVIWKNRYYQKAYYMHHHHRDSSPDTTPPRIDDDEDYDDDHDECADTTVYAAAKNKTIMTAIAPQAQAQATRTPSAHYHTAKWMKSKCPSSLAHPEDRNHVNTLHCFVREECIEVFQANKTDVAASRKGRRMPIALNRVGLRCKFCSSNSSRTCSSGGKRANGSVHYPSSLEDIYIAVTTWQRVHFMKCDMIPEQMRQKYRYLKSNDRGRGKRSYWAESAQAIGLVDDSSSSSTSDDDAATVGGIRFDPSSLQPKRSATTSTSRKRKRSDDEEEDEEEEEGNALMLLCNEQEQTSSSSSSLEYIYCDDEDNTATTTAIHH